MKKFFAFLLAASLLCACGDIEPLPNENGNGDQVENGGNSGDGTENEGNEGSGNEGSGNEGSGNDNNGGNNSDLGGNTTVNQTIITLLPTSAGWPVESYPTSDRKSTRLNSSH